jgi:hypothetical protein
MFRQSLIKVTRNYPKIKINSYSQEFIKIKFKEIKNDTLVIKITFNYNYLNGFFGFLDYNKEKDLCDKFNKLIYKYPYFFIKPFDSTANFNDEKSRYIKLIKKYTENKHSHHPNIKDYDQ